MTLSAGVRLGSYDILGALGAGGMGEVYPKLFDFTYAMAVPMRTFDVAHDGQRFLIVKEAESERATGQQVNVIVALNWLDEIRDRLSAK